MNDADIEMNELERAGTQIGRLRRKGICLHNWTKTPPDGSAPCCFDCGKTWANADAMRDEIDELRSEYL